MEVQTCGQCGDSEFKTCFLGFDFDGSVQPFEIKQCKQCGLALTWPMPKPEDMDNYYPDTYYGSGKKKFSGVIEYLTQLGCKWRAEAIHQHAPQPLSEANVLDVGCGRAGLLRSLQSLGYRCYGTERSSFPDKSAIADLEIFTGSLAEADYADEHFDAVSIWHVLEHLHDPFETLDDIARVTRKGGLLAIAVPNFSSWQSRLFKAAWFHLDLPRHLYHFDVQSLTQALIKRGYQVTSMSTCSFEQNVFGFIQSLMNKLLFLGKPNEFYQLLKKRSGVRQTLKLIFWAVLAGLILPIALLEFIFSCLFKKGASVIIFAHKTKH